MRLYQQGFMAACNARKVNAPYLVKLAWLMPLLKGVGKLGVSMAAMSAGDAVAGKVMRPFTKPKSIVGPKMDPGRFTIPGGPSFQLPGFNPKY